MSHAHALPVTGCWVLVVVGGWWSLAGLCEVRDVGLFTLRSGNVWKPNARSVTAGSTDDCLLSF